MNLAVESYKNQQQIYNQRVYPLEWAQIQEKIGKIYYLLGKQDDDEKLMREAKNYYLSALDVYHETNMKTADAKAKKMLAKIADYIN